MKNKTKVILIMMMSVVTLLCGISVAYYNTYSTLFEDEPVIVSIKDGEYSFLDFTVKAEDIKRVGKKLEKVFPKSSINM